MAAAQPPTGEGRIATIDALRGVAVLGILLMNIASFALPRGAYYNPLGATGAGSADIAVWAVEYVLVDGKMRALFSMLFGASLLIIADRWTVAGRDAGRLHLRRMGSLLLIGLIHLYLIWPGDILAHYAIVGTFAWFFVHLSRARLLSGAVLLFLINLAIAAATGLGVWLMAQDAAAPDASADAISAWVEMGALIGAAPPAMIAEEVALMRGPYAAWLADRLDWAAPFSLLLTSGAETLGLMLLGMWGVRSEFLTGAWTKARYRRTAIVAYAISIPPLLFLALACIATGLVDPWPFLASSVAGAPFHPVMAIGHAALLIPMLCGQCGWLAPRLAAAGRVALTNYLGISIVMSALFNGWGLGLFGIVSRAELLAVVLVGWAAMLGWPLPWLNRYRHGPVEWLWRSLIFAEIQPMRRTAADTIATS